MLLSVMPPLDINWRLYTPGMKIWQYFKTEAQIQCAFLRREGNTDAHQLAPGQEFIKFVLKNISFLSFLMCNIFYLNCVNIDCRK
jgi:hypothetical protein